MRNNLIIVCLLSGLSLPVCGQSTLDDCIRYAWKHNPGFKNVQIDVKEARTDYVAAMGKFPDRQNVRYACPLPPVLKHKEEIYP